MMHNLRAARMMRVDPHPMLRTHTMIRTTPPSTPPLARAIHAMQLTALHLTRAATTPRNMLPSLDIFCDIL